MEDKLSKEGFKSWLESTYTQLVFDLLKDKEQMYLNAIVEGTENVYPDEVYKGYIMAVRDITGITFDEVDS